MATEEMKYRTVEGEDITPEEVARLQSEYWSQVEASDGFDIEGIRAPPFGRPMRCNYFQGFIANRILVKRYATVGLHRYNMLKGTNFELSAPLKVNTLANCVSSYYMTLVAYDPDTRVQKTFQVRVDEERHATLDITVSVARVKDEVTTTTKKPFVPHFDGGAVTDDARFQGELPDWPSRNAFNDTNRFYVVKESELRNTYWITLYFELAVVANNRHILYMDNQNDILTNLKILKVVIETTEDEKLEAKCAHVYITFKGLEEDVRSDKLGEHVERKVIVRSVLDESTGYLSLRGKLWNPKSTKKRSGEKAQSSKKSSKKKARRALV